MTHDTERILQHLLYSAFRRFSLDAFILNLGTFLIEYLPIMSIALKRFENKRITTLSYHCFNNLLAPPPKVIELSDELMQELYMHPSMSAYKYAARVVSTQEEGPYQKIYNLMSRKEESSIYFPLIIDDFLTTSLYIAISTIGSGKYTDEHRAFCEKIRAPLAAALTNVLQHEALASEPAPANGGRRKSSNPSESLSQLQEPPLTYPTLDAVIKSHIRKTLDLTQGRVSGPKGAARLLGVPSSTLSSKIRRLGISVPREKNE